jgi:signal transduction histidine kinase
MSAIKYDAPMPFESDDFERRLIAQLEAQQTHIAQELHDALGSQLSAMVMMIGAIKNALPHNKVQTQALEQLMQQAQDAVKITRQLARGLMPLDQEPGALWRMLERACLDYDQIPGRSCEFIRHDDLAWIGGELANALHRIAQEALTNAFRHGQARRVVLSCLRQDGLGCMTVQDDGVGMPTGPTQGAVVPGVGLRTMQARSRIAGATLAIERRHPVGTTVRITWPIPA